MGARTAATHTFTMFDSLHDFMDGAFGGKAASAANKDDYARAVVTNRSPEFLGLPNAASCSDIRKMVNDGWQEGAQRIAEQMGHIEAPPVQGVRRRPVWRDHGDEVNMDRVRGGQLDTAWWGLSRRLGNQPPRVRILVDTCINANIDSSMVFLRGACGVKLTELLYGAGYQVELWGGASTTTYWGAAGTVGYGYLVKPYTAPFDGASAAAGVALPALFRTIGIATLFKTAHASWPGAGRAMPLDTEPFTDEGTRLFTVPDNITTVAKANEWIASCIETLELSYMVERGAV